MGITRCHTKEKTLMTGTKFAKGDVIHQEGDRTTQLCIIASGSVRASNSISEMTLSKGEVLGVCESQGIYYPFECTALEETTLYIYPYTAFSDIAALITDNPAAAGIMTNAFAQKCYSYFEIYSSLLMDCQTLYDTACEQYEEYQRLCEYYQVPALELPGLAQLGEFTIDSVMEDWLLGYYTSLNSMSAARWKTFYEGCPDACAGFILKASADMLYVLPFCERLHRYLDMIYDLFLSDFNMDIFTYYLELYKSITANSDSVDVSPVRDRLERIMLMINNEMHIDRELIDNRMAEYREVLPDKSKNVSASSKMDADTMQKISASLKDSIDTITGYAGINEPDARRFRSLIKKYHALPDQGASDDETKNLRKELTTLFYDTYKQAFLNSISDPVLPTELKMFFYFGYVDEELIGLDNAVFLYYLAEKMQPDPKENVFTLYEWLKKVYDGVKEPCINELNVDYTAYLHNLRVTGKLTVEQENAALRDSTKRFTFEFDNMFRLTNKVTYGRISTFCPVLSEHNLYKEIDGACLTPERIHEVLNKIRSVDYSAYYRETVYSDPDHGITKELVQAEVLPDIILMPNIGTRGVMWQEITGRKRNSPARMMISIISMEDLYPTMVRLTAEFRWELCRRIQGVRWNDISERSLTSDYCEYLQTYKKNRDLSPEAKEKLKLAIQKARNSSKEMFVRDYIDYIMFEGSGSIRMNKLSRYLLFNYCPFAKEVRDAMESNPLYKEIIERYNNKHKQAMHINDMLMQKMSNSNIEVPAEMKAHRMFLQM